jgi:hypothetical protein
VAKCLDLIHRPRQAPHGAQVFDPGTFDRRFDDLWQRISREKSGIIRDSTYLNWRYVDHPIYAYQILAKGTGERLDGFMVTTRREVLGLDAVLIVDWAADPGRSETLPLLIEHVVSQARLSRAAIVGALASPGSDFAPALRRSGFLPVPGKLDPKPFFLAAKALTGNVAEPAQTVFGHWSWGDMDVV